MGRAANLSQHASSASRTRLTPSQAPRRNNGELRSTGAACAGRRGRRASATALGGDRRSHVSREGTSWYGVGGGADGCSCVFVYC